MRIEMKTAFRPSLESIEDRIVATAGVGAAAAAHHVAAHPTVQIESQHKKLPAPHPAAVATPPAKTHPAHKATPAPVTPLPKETTTDQAWVELVNMTGEDLEYQIKLGPYANGQFIPFDIAAGANQVRYSSLISNGQRVNPDFAIQFDNGPITPLTTGISQQSAQGYYIFLDDNFQPYVEPFYRS